MKCEGCEATVPAEQIHACAECGRKVCEGCGTEVSITNLPPSIDAEGVDDSLQPKAWLCDQCYHWSFELEDDEEDETSGGV